MTVWNYNNLRKCDLQPVLSYDLSHYTNGHVIAIWALSTWFAFTTVAASCSHMTMICVNQTGNMVRMNWFCFILRLHKQNLASLKTQNFPPPSGWLFPKFISWLLSNCNSLPSLILSYAASSLLFPQGHSYIQLHLRPFQLAWDKQSKLWKPDSLNNHTICLTLSCSLNDSCKN